MQRNPFLNIYIFKVYQAYDVGQYYFMYTHNYYISEEFSLNAPFITITYIILVEDVQNSDAIRSLLF